MTLRRKVAHWLRLLANWLYPDIRITVRVDGADRAVRDIERIRHSLASDAEIPVFGIQTLEGTEPPPR